MGKKKEKAITVVIDTNVLVSALIFKGDSSCLIDIWEKGDIRPLFSKATFEEFRRVLEYPKFHLSSQEINAIIREDVLPFFDVIAPIEEKTGFSRDPEDDKFITLAIAADADFVISGDKDLLILKKVGKTRIIRLSDFLKTTVPNPRL